jgi:hypothetical protein
MNKISQTRWLIVAMLASLAFAAWTPSAEARNYRSGRSYHRGYRGGRYGYRGNPVANAYAAQMRAAYIRAAAIRAAQAEVHRSYNYLRSTRVRLEREFKYSDALGAAEKEHRDAQYEYNQALAKLRDNPAYEHTLEAVRNVHDRLVALQNQPYSTPQERIALADKQATLQQALEHMRRDAKLTDSTFDDATRRSYEAAGKQAELRRQFEASITQNPKWQAAREGLEQARKKLAMANMAGIRGVMPASRPSYASYRK